MKAAQLRHTVLYDGKASRKPISNPQKKNTFNQLFKQMLILKLWTLDDWGVVSTPRDVSGAVFELFDRRKHSSAMSLTSNRDVK